MSIILRYKDFKSKAFILSYDDLSIYDQKLISIMNKYNAKCTFNLCTGYFNEPLHINKEDFSKVYLNPNIEVACHGEYHKFLNECSNTEIYNELINDKLCLESLTSSIIRGYAYAEGYYDKNVIDIASKIGLLYSRTTKDTNLFNAPVSLFELHPTIYHLRNNALDLIDNFLSLNPKFSYNKKSLVFIMWGHSIELEQQNKWDYIDNILYKLSIDPEVVFMTTIEYIEYLNAFNNLIYSADNKMIRNDSNIDLYICHNKREIVLKANTVLKLED